MKKDINLNELLVQLEILTSELRSKEQKTDGLLRFAEKEISKMPKEFKKEFRTHGCIAYIRKKQKNENSCSYEIRYRRDGYNISASGTTISLAKTHFIQAIKTANKDENYINHKIKRTQVKENSTILKNGVPATFIDFSNYYFENFRFRKVCDETKDKTLQMFNLYLKPFFNNILIEKIIPANCQQLIDRIFNEGKKRTAKEVFSILSQTLKMAVRHNIISHNPCDIVFVPNYEKKHSKALTKKEEKLLLEKTAGTPYQAMFALALYTGLRPNEYRTARLDGKFIIAINSKQKDGKVHYKKIPISPMLKPFVDDLKNLKVYYVDRIREKIKEILGPERKLYDLRVTFNTRCQECGVSDVAREKFMGHSLKGLNEIYTDLSDEFLYNESQKLKY